MKAFRTSGYAAHFKILDSCMFHLPQRRHRCWMWAFLGKNQDMAEVSMPTTLQSLTSSTHFTVDQVCDGMGAATPHELSTHESRVVTEAMRKHTNGGGLACDDLFVDITKSEVWAPHCHGAFSCVVPNSRPYRVRDRSVASPLHKMCVQGLWPRDFPAMSAFSDNESLLSDLAGNAFTSTVCMAVALGTLVHAFPSAAKRGPKRKHVSLETIPVIWRWEHAIERPRTFRRLRKPAML